MARPAGKRAEPASSETAWIIGGGALAVVVVLACTYWFSAVVDETITAAVGSKSFFAIAGAQLSGAVPFTTKQGLTLLAVFLGLALVVGLIIYASTYARKSRKRGDEKAKLMAHARDLEELMEKSAAADAQRLGATGASNGVPLGKLVNNMRRLFGSWEWVQIWIMGPRAGKTSCVCVPQILETQGPVVATSNKRDIVDMTRGPRSRLGTVWVHDVQDIIHEPATWYWNPLTFVDSLERAEKLTAIFAAAQTSAGAREDAYFGPASKELLSRYFYAAALGKRPITDVYKWVNDETDYTAVKILREHGEGGLSAGLEKTQTVTDKQRDGIYGQVRTWVGILGDPKLSAWVRPNFDTTRPEFDPAEFVRSRDTIYLVSREGGGSARAITAALAMAILTEAEKIAAGQPGGRLSTPLMAVLDEAANVVRWPELPDLYSHYGSRGIVVSTFFQSYQQGVEAFGEHGFPKMWSAANVRVAGSGLSEDKFLPFLSQLIGNHDEVKRNESTQKGGRSSSKSVQKETTLEVSELAGLARGRAILTASGQPAAMLALEHYSEKEYAADVDASQAYYEGVAAKQVVK